MFTIWRAHINRNSKLLVYSACTNLHDGGTTMKTKCGISPRKWIPHVLGGRLCYLSARFCGIPHVAKFVISHGPMPNRINILEKLQEKN